MNNYESWEIGGHCLEYLDDTHTYICDGIILPSITQCLKLRFGNKYAGIDDQTLKQASMRGTECHRAIEEYCKTGVESEMPEVRNFKFLQKQYGFKVLENETPVILSIDDEPVIAGRLDLVLDIDGKTGLGDIKRVSALDKEYLGLQLNLYRIAYQQTYGIEIEFLKGLHLKDDTRKFVNIPINEKIAWELVDEYMRGQNNEKI